MEVKQPTRGRPKKGKNNLTKSSIISNAREWMLQENKHIGIRSLARYMKIDPMAIYHYFENKSALLEAITTSMMQEIYIPTNNADWQFEIKLLSKSYLRLLVNYPGLLETLLSMGKAAKGPASVFKERFDIIIVNLSINEDIYKTAINFLIDYLHGFALAIQLAKGEHKPKINDIEKPLELYFYSLNMVVDKNKQDQ